MKKESISVIRVLGMVGSVVLAFSIALLLPIESGGVKVSLAFILLFVFMSLVGYLTKSKE